MALKEPLMKMVFWGAENAVYNTDLSNFKPSALTLYPDFAASLGTSYTCF